MSETWRRLVSLFLVFLRLGLTSFGGPVVHLGYFRAELVERRRWLGDQGYAELVALCQFLPGPASSQVVIGIGLTRGGVAGALAASLGFTLPSLAAMILFGYGLAVLGGDAAGAGWIHALKVVAAAVVAQAIWAMGRSLCPDRLRASIALSAAVMLVLWPLPGMQLAVIGAGALIGWRGCAVPAADAGDVLPVTIGRRTAALLLGVFALLLAWAVLGPISAGLPGLDLFALMYRTGALVFGGGHVVLPLLESQMVAGGRVGADAFLAGYGAAQALPGPLFTFAGFLGVVQGPAPNGWLGGLVAVAGIFLPSFLLVFGVLPFWARLRRSRAARAALAGVNAAVVGLLIAVFYDPVWRSAIRDGSDFALALAAFGLLAVWRVPAWMVVIGAGGLAWLAGWM